MNSHDKRTGTFDYLFKNDPNYGLKILSADMVKEELFEKITNGYAYDLNHMTEKELKREEKRKEKIQKQAKKKKDSLEKKAEKLKANGKDVPETKVKEYVDPREDMPILVGLYDKKKNPKGKRGILFTDYKMYFCFKRKRYAKIWYDEIVKIYPKFLNPSKLVIKTEDGERYVLKTSKRINKKIIEFVNQIKEYNEDISKPNYDINYLKNNSNVLAAAAGIEIGRRVVIDHAFDEERFHAKQGHGFVAERANDKLDRIEGKHAEIVGDNNVKDGADRAIKYSDGRIELIQTKYYQNAKAGVEACFNKEGDFRYFDSNNKPMSVEVPKDQYEEAIQVMQKKIADGKVKGVNDPNEAKNIIKKGHLTYKQAVNIAKAGTIESITYDAINGMVVASSAFGISAIVSLATSVWNGDEFGVALKNASFIGAKVGGASFLTSVISAQLSKAGLNSALRKSSEAIVNKLGTGFQKALANAFRTGKTISGAAAASSAAKILRNNIITSAVTVVVFSFFDFVNLIRRRITILQFLKNFVVLLLSVIASVGAGLGGAALGTLILPGVGSFIGSFGLAILAGSLVSHFGKKLMGVWIKEDSDKMFDIIQEEFNQIAEDYLLSEVEAEKIGDKLGNKLSINVIRKMVASKDKNEYAKKLLTPIAETQVKKRKKIKEPPTEVMIAAINQLAIDLEKEGELV